MDFSSFFKSSFGSIPHDVLYNVLHTRANRFNIVRGAIHGSVDKLNIFFIYYQM